MVGLVLGPGLYNWFFLFRFRRKMNPKKVLTGAGGGDHLRGPNARVSLE